MSPSVSRALVRANTHLIGCGDLRARSLRRYRPEVRDAVHALARRHTRLADLAVSFPALLAALAVRRAGFDSEPVIRRVIEGASLTEAAASTGIPMWLRKFPPEFIPSAIPRLPDGDLFRHRIANHLPSDSKSAPAWLDIVATAAEWGHEIFALWCAKRFVAEPKKFNRARLHLLCLWSWYSGQPETRAYQLMEKRWTPEMHFRAACNAAEQWQLSMSLYINLGDSIIDDMWLKPGEQDGFEFVPLRSRAEIEEEAKAMANCLRSYGPNVAQGWSRLWSIRKEGKRVATVNVRYTTHEPLPFISELKARHNGDAPTEVWLAARGGCTNRMGWNLRGLILDGTRLATGEFGCRLGAHTGSPSGAFQNGCHSILRGTV